MCLCALVAKMSQWILVFIYLIYYVYCDKLYACRFVFGRQEV